MEPRIQYAKTSDGASIAYASQGHADPLILMGLPPFSTLIWWTAFGGDTWRPFLQTYRVIFYDSRGCGYSDRSADDFSLDAMIRDLDSVVNAEELEKFVLLAFVDSVLTAVSYAAQHPGRVTHLILCDGYVSTEDFLEAAAWEMQMRLKESDWKLFTETFAQVMWASEDSAYAKLLAEWMRESCSQEVWFKSQDALEGRDISSLLAHVRCPTLVIQNRNNRFLQPRSNQRLAAGIPRARLAVIEDITYATVPGMVAEFTGGPAADVTRGRADSPSGTAIILFADITDSTGLTERLGDAAFRAKARDFDGVLRTVIHEHAGAAIEGKLLGDGVLAVFTSARQAIEAARECAEAGNRDGLPLHLGLHAGDVIREEGNVYGGAVNIAARISGLSAPGELLVSDIVRGLARTSAGVSFEDRGEHRLKGVSDPVRVWAITSAGVTGQSESPSNASSAYPDHLTTREVEVLRLIADGRTNAEISLELALSARTVARHITNIYGKIGARSKADATAYAIRHHLTED